MKEPIERAAGAGRGGDGRPPRPGWILALGIVPVALNLRVAVTSIPPILPILIAELRLSATAASLLIALPTLCFGVVSFAAAPIRAFFGDERGIFAALVAITAGLAARALVPTHLLFAGTILACAGIGVLNVLLTSLIRHRSTQHVGRLLAVNILCLNLGAVVASAVAVPIDELTHSLLPTLGVWALLGLVGVVTWLPQIRRRRDPATQRGDEMGVFRVARVPLAWVLALFMGLQSLSYYAMASWLPTLLQTRGMAPVEAGLLVALLSVVGLASGTVGPLLTRGVRAQRVVVVAGFVAQGVAFAGLVGAPLALAPLWAAVAGLGQGALLPLALFFLIDRAADTATAAALSSFGQGIGYLVASAGAFAVGQLYDATHAWGVPLLLFLVVLAAAIGCGLGGSRGQQVASIVSER